MSESAFLVQKLSGQTYNLNTSGDQGFSLPTTGKNHPYSLYGVLTAVAALWDPPQRPPLFFVWYCYTIVDLSNQRPCVLEVVTDVKDSPLTLLCFISGKTQYGNGSIPSQPGCTEVALIHPKIRPMENQMWGA